MSHNTIAKYAESITLVLYDPIYNEVAALIQRQPQELSGKKHGARRR